MTIQYSTAVRIARLDAIESSTGTSAKLRLRSGAAPALCSDARTGTIIATLELPSDWLGAASAAGNVVTKAKSGTWEDAAGTSGADNAGTIAHFEIMDSTLTTCHMQGTVTATAGGGDMTVDNTVVTAGQVVTVTGFTLTAGNA